MENLNETDETLTEISLTAWSDKNESGQLFNEFIVSPNSASGKITIRFIGDISDASLKIFDMQNSILLSTELVNFELDLDISAFTAGQYLIILENNGILYSQKLIKQ